MNISNILWRGMAISLGCAAVAADGFNTLSQAIEAKMTLDIVATVAVIIVVMSLALPLSVWAYTNQNKKYGALCAAVFLGAWAVSYGYSVNRMGYNRMNEAHAINKANVKGMLATENLVVARAKLEAANLNLAREEVTGKGPRWKEAFNLKEQAKSEVKKAEAQIEPMKHSTTHESTKYLIYAVPFVAQCAGVVCFLIGFGAMNKDSSEAKKDVIEELLNQPPLIEPYKQSEDRVYTYLKECANGEEWRTTYRKISQATGVNIAFVKEHLTDLHYRRKIVIEGSTKGRGTWGKINEANLLVAT